MNTSRTYTPTCPVNRSQVNRIARTRICVASAIVLVLSIALAGFLAKTSSLSDVFVAAVSLTAGVVTIVANAITRRASIENQVIQGLIAKSNAEQDVRLKQIVEQLRSSTYSVCLEKFALMKMNIERSLHQDGVFTKEKERIEIVVDEIVDSVSVEMQSLECIDSHLETAFLSCDFESVTEIMRHRENRYRLIMRAHESLRLTSQKFAPQQKPTPTLKPVFTRPDSRLESAIIELEEHNHVRNRIDRELSDRYLTQRPASLGPAENSRQV